MGVTVIKQLPKFSGKIKTGLAETMRQASLYLQSSANRKINKGVQPPNAPLTQEVKGGSQTLRGRTGNLMGSIGPHNGEKWAAASTNVKYARILQTGGTIMSKGKGLWLPAGAKTIQLYRRYNATSPGQLITALKAAGYSFAWIKNVYCAKPKKGTLFALFIKKSSVVIPARPYLYIDSSDERYLTNLIRQAYFTALKED